MTHSTDCNSVEVRPEQLALFDRDTPRMPTRNYAPGRATPGAGLFDIPPNARIEGAGTGPCARLMKLATDLDGRDCL